MKDKLLASVLRNVNLSGMAADALDDALEPALQKVVDDSANPFDNMLMAAVYPALEAALKEELAKREADLKAKYLGEDA